MTNIKNQGLPRAPEPQRPAETPDQKPVQAMARDPRIVRVMTDPGQVEWWRSQNQLGEARSDYDPLSNEKIGARRDSPMGVLGYSESSNRTELWREKAVTERAFALISAKEWPPPVGWLDDLLSRDWIPPEGDFWETVRREPRSVRLICKDGNRVD
jgi:hypothetical protein